ncbi:MAG: hypothetical protein ACD_46C00377G0001 [uncultured bacterium]|nr:MAG: hypothetical protein ACD_46C00377G0001 [uncultured bacterium]
MSFKKFKPSESSPTAALLTKHEQLPVFLIPGIFGNGNEMQQLADELYKNSKGTRPIYIWFDPRLSNPIKNDAWTLEQNVDDIENRINEILKNSLLPAIIISYSYGCTVAAKVEQKRKSNGQDSHNIMIDSASPELTKEYFFSESNAATPDMINIANYAARLTALYEIKHDGIDIEKLNILLPQSRLEQIEGMVLSYNDYKPDENCRNFQDTMSVGKQNLQSLSVLGSSDEPQKIKLDKINLIFTKESAKKHGSLTGGWEQYSDSVNLLNNDKLMEQHHSDLLNKTNAAILAPLITSTIKKEVDLKPIMAKQIQLLVRMQQEVDNVEADTSDEADIKMTDFAPKKSALRALSFTNSSNTAIRAKPENVVPQLKIKA